MISGTVGPQAGNYFDGTYSVEVIVDDQHGASVVRSFDWVVSDVTHAPSIASIAGQSGGTGGSVSLQVSATDPDGDALFYDASGLPDGHASRRRCHAASALAWKPAAK